MITIGIISAGYFINKMVFNKSKSAKSNDGQELIPKSTKSAGESNGCPKPKSGIMNGLRRSFSRKKVPKKAQVLTSKQERQILLNEDQMRREDPGLAREPNRLRRRAITKTNTVAIREAVKTKLEDQEKIVDLPMIEESEYDANNRRLVSLYNPVTDCTMTLAQKLKKITTIRDAHELSMLLQKPALATRCSSRIKYWLDSIIRVHGNGDLQFMKDDQKSIVTRYLVKIAVAHFDFSLKNQRILNMLPGEAVLEEDGFKSYSLITRKGNPAFRDLNNDERTRANEIIGANILLFDQIMQLTRMIKPDNEDIMSYEEALCLLTYLTGNRYLELWPTHLCSGSRHFRRLPYTTLASHTLDILEAAETYDEEQPDVRRMRLNDRPQSYYRCLIDLMQAAPNATIPLEDWEIRDEICEDGRRKIYEYLVPGPYPSLAHEATGDGVRPKQRHASIKSKLQEARSMVQSKVQEAEQVQRRVDDQDQIQKKIDEIMQDMKTKRHVDPKIFQDQIDELEREHNRLMDESASELKKLSENYERGRRELDVISDEEQGAMARRREDDGTTPMPRLNPQDTPYQTAHDWEYSARQIGGSFLHTQMGGRPPPLNPEYSTIKKVTDAARENGKPENHQNTPVYSEPLFASAPQTQFKQPSGDQSGGSTTNPQKSPKKIWLMNQLSTIMSEPEMSQLSENQLEELLYSQKIRLILSPSPPKRYEMVMRYMSDGSRTLVPAENNELADCALTQSEMEELRNSPQGINEEMVGRIPNLKSLWDRCYKNEKDSGISASSLQTHADSSNDPQNSSDNTIPPSNGNTPGYQLKEAGRTDKLNAAREDGRSSHRHSTPNIPLSQNNKATGGAAGNTSPDNSPGSIPNFQLNLEDSLSQAPTPLNSDESEDATPPPLAEGTVPLKKQKRLTQAEVDDMRAQLGSANSVPLPESGDEVDDRTSEKHYVEEQEQRRKKRVQKNVAPIHQRTMASRRAREETETRQRLQREEEEEKKRERAKRRSSQQGNSKAQICSPAYDDGRFTPNKTAKR